jgi:hypothetical protein
MKDLSLRPKSDYLYTASFQELYLLTERWLLDMDFYRDELNFLYKLVDKYFMLLLQDEDISAVQTLIKHIDATKREHFQLDSSMQDHLKHIGVMAENPFSQDEQQFRDEHAMLEKEMEEFIVDFKQTKKEVFAMTEHAMLEEKMKHLLT